MGRQWNQIIESLGPLTGGTVSINANLGDIDALLTTLQADIADGITLTKGSSSSVTTFTSATSAQILASNNSRKVVTIFNSTPNVLYVKLGSSSVSSTSYSFAIGEKELLSLSNITTELRGIYSTSGTAYVTEIT